MYNSVKMERHLILYDDELMVRKIVLLKVDAAVTDQLIRMRNCVKLMSRNQMFQIITEKCSAARPFHFSLASIFTVKHSHADLQDLMVDDWSSFMEMYERQKTAQYKYVFCDCRINMNKQFDVQITWQDTYGEIVKMQWYPLEKILGYQIPEPLGFRKRIFKLLKIK